MSGICNLKTFPFLRVLSVVFPDSLKEPRFVGDEMQTDRVAADAQSDHHWQPQRQSSAW